MRRAYLFFYFAGLVAIMWVLAHATDLQARDWDGDAVVRFILFAAMPLAGGLPVLFRPVWAALGRLTVIATAIVATTLAAVVVVIGVPRYVLDGRESEITHAFGDALLWLSAHGGVALLIAAPILWLIRRSRGGRQAAGTA